MIDGRGAADHGRRMSGALLIPALLAALAGPALAADAGAAGSASNGELSVIQFSGLDPEAVLAEWSKPSAGVHIRNEAQGRRDRPIYTFVVFKGCRTDASGNCNLVADFEVEDPAGKPYVQQKGVRTWVDRPPAPAPNYILALGYMGLVVEQKDAPGPYRVRMTLTDKVSGVILHSEQVLTITE